MRRDFEVEVASEAMEAIEKLRTTLSAAVLLDLVTPMHDGSSILDFLKSTRQRLL